MPEFAIMRLGAHTIHMKKVAISQSMLAVFGAALLSACAAGNYTSPVEVTRFSAEDTSQLAKGTIAVVPAPGTEGGADDGSFAFGAYADAVSAELAALGYQVVSPDQASQLAELRLDSFVEQAQRSRGPVSVGVGGSTGGYRSGVGLGIGLDLSGPPPEILSSEIGVIIRDAASRDSLWEGRAGFSTRADGDLAQASANAAKLAEALFVGFPGESGETISVK